MCLSKKEYYFWLIVYLFSLFSVPFLSNDYDYYYEDNFNNIDKAKIPEKIVTTPQPPTTR